MKYRKRPVVVEAMQWTGCNITEMRKFTGRDISRLLVSGELYIETLEGTHHASIGDYIIKGVKGEFYPCKPDVFGQTYEAAEGEHDGDATTKIQTAPGHGEPGPEESQQVADYIEHLLREKERVL